MHIQSALTEIMNSNGSRLSDLPTPMAFIRTLSKYGGPIDRLHQGMCRPPIEAFLVATAAAAPSPARLRCGYPNLCRRALFSLLCIRIE